MNNKKIFIPIVSIVLLIILLTFKGCPPTIIIEYDSTSKEEKNIDSLELKVYVENSGSMDAYMCLGSNLKDAVFAYVSDWKTLVDSFSLYYINSQIIQYSGSVESYIKDLTPASFARAGGNRKDTDLRSIFSNILDKHNRNTISVLVSDCILDIPQSATDFFGNCQVSIKNSFNEVLSKHPDLGVEIIRLDSKFEGYWYCGKNSSLLDNVRRPYFIWIIGNKKVLSELNRKVPINDVIGGIKNYGAYSTSCTIIPFEIEKKKYKSNGKPIKVEVLVNLQETLQSEDVLLNINNYEVSEPSQVKISSINKIVAKDSKFSHVINLEITNPEILRTVNISFSYPQIPIWVEQYNDSTGDNIQQNMDKTTGLLYLVRGVADAYKNHLDFGKISFKLKNK